MRACAELPKLCEFFHIPFQSGDNDILRDMKWVQQDSLSIDTKLRVRSSIDTKVCIRGTELHRLAGVVQERLHTRALQENH